MEFFIKNATIKKILISLILIILLGNFAMPNYVQADGGGALTKPIFEFVAWLGDVVIKFLQKTFLGVPNITDGIQGAVNVSSYTIFYSPYNIFAGNIPSLSINFINPDSETKTITFGTRTIAKHSHDLIAAYDQVERTINILKEFGYSGVDSEYLYPGELDTEISESESEEEGVETEPKKGISNFKFNNNIELKEVYDWGNYKKVNDKWEKKDGNPWDENDLAFILWKCLKSQDNVLDGSWKKIEDIVDCKYNDTLKSQNKNWFQLYGEFEYNGKVFKCWGRHEEGMVFACITYGDNMEKARVLVSDGAFFSNLAFENVGIKDIKTICEEMGGYTEEALENLETTVIDYEKLEAQGLFTYNWLMEKSALEISWEYNGETYILQRDDSDDVDANGMPTITKLAGETTNILNADLAKELQGTIAKWYKALRTFALVGLLSVLVYIGIRIIISSSSADKAKYKKMLANWLAAVCIIFVLHYIMVFILNITKQITDILANNSSNQIIKDEAMSYFRTEISKSEDFVNLASETICYVALVILTCVFTIQYLKRVVYMAFLTMIAPLIALTYPLDKIKDGKAQAFSMWLKEYIFNSLLQPIHLLLYTILVTSVGTTFIKTNPLYVIVAIAFLVPAEKFFRKMFGMESQTPVGTLGAAAGGAMVMSMLNKMKGKPAKEEKEEGKGRTSKSKNSKWNRR